MKMSMKRLGHNYWYDLIYCKDDLTNNLSPQLVKYVGQVVSDELLKTIRSEIEDYLTNSGIAFMLHFDCIAAIATDDQNKIISIPLTVVDSDY